MVKDNETFQKRMIFNTPYLENEYLNPFFPFLFFSARHVFEKSNYKDYMYLFTNILNTHLPRLKLTMDFLFFVGRQMEALSQDF